MTREKIDWELKFQHFILYGIAIPQLEVSRLSRSMKLTFRMLAFVTLRWLIIAVFHLTAYSAQSLFMIQTPLFLLS